MVRFGSTSLKLLLIQLSCIIFILLILLLYSGKHPFDPDDVYHFKTYEYIIIPGLDHCRLRPPFILALVLSTADNFDVRETIRETWANGAKSNAVKNNAVSVYFILSTTQRPGVINKVHEESSKYRDIILTDLEENYDNLVYKVNAAFGFHSQFCPEADYLLKIDDDVVVDFDRMMYFLMKTPVPLTAIQCQTWENAPVIRNISDKWHAPRSVWSEEHFPTYCSGPMYVVGSHAVHRIWKLANKFEPFRLEDVFFTGILAEKAGVQRIGWVRHYLVQEKALWRGEWDCDEQKEPLLFGVHSLNSTRLKKGFNYLKNLSCSKSDTSLTQ